MDPTRVSATKLLELGHTPLPKYISRPVEPEDEERYQTIYAKYEGAVAAPTAGLHFSKQLMKRLEIKGINFAELTLHIGLGTFNPVEVEDLSKHKMDSEEIIIPQEACQVVNKAKEAGKACMRCRNNSDACHGEFRILTQHSESFHWVDEQVHFPSL